MLWSNARASAFACDRYNAVELCEFATVSRSATQKSARITFRKTSAFPSRSSDVLIIRIY